LPARLWRTGEPDKRGRHRLGGQKDVKNPHEAGKGCGVATARVNAPACYAEAGEYSGYLDDTGVVDISVKVVFAHKKAATCEGCGFRGKL